MFNPILPLTLDDLPDCLALAQDREWVALRNSTTVMVHGGQPLPGDRSRWFIPLMQALG